tara:strand:+ start:18640 stop:19221 length:582 start_codon:yes stop_codon:yes gene_type:complete
VIWLVFLQGCVAALIGAAVLVWTAQRIATGKFDLRDDLPLDLCNLSALLAPSAMFFDAPLLIAWGVCVGGPGGLVSLVMPDLEPRHDRTTQIKFWLVHIGLVANALLISLQARPTGAIQLIQLLATVVALLAIVTIVNHRLHANYMFLRHKPATPSLLDAYGRWPLYIAPMVATSAAAIAATYGLWSLWYARG